MTAMGSSNFSGVTVVFDFDKTIIDCDSDNWVVDSLGVTEEFNRLLPTMPWNSLMDEMMRQIHSQGTSVSRIADCLHIAPLDPDTVAAIKVAHALGCDVRIVSDANLFFINTVLEHHGLLGCFTEINTNPSHVDGDGRLRITPYHDFRRDPPHGCRFCPPNMCKGHIIDRIRAEVGPHGRFVYLGDGTGDFCSSLEFSAEDFVMPRKDYPLWELIQSTHFGGNLHGKLAVKAEIHAWSSWVEQRETLIRLVEKAASAHGDCSAAVGAVNSDSTPAFFPPIVPHVQEVFAKPLLIHQ